MYNVLITITITKKKNQRRTAQHGKMQAMLVAKVPREMVLPNIIHNKKISAHENRCNQNSQKASKRRKNT